MSVTGLRVVALTAAVWGLVVQAQGTASVSGDGRPLAQDFAQSSLTIETSAFACEHFAIFVAEQSAQQARGLMFVREMPDDVGMIFVYPQERMLAMWMKNTLIPLDMLFTDSAGTIVHVAENATPGSLATISSQRSARAVLEINGGLAKRLGIRPGDRVRHTFFD